MRDRLKDELGDVPYSDFLVYLMGPYTTFDVEALLPAGVDEADISISSSSASGDAIDDMLGILRHVQGSLRTDPGVNAFLAVDAGIPLEEMDAATQSIEFARASNAIAFVVPSLGDNLGVGMEVGAVLEDRYPESDRVLLAHEANVSSAMLGGVTQRWGANIVSYSDEDELTDELRLFVGQLMVEEAIGDLPKRGG